MAGLHSNNDFRTSIYHKISDKLTVAILLSCLAIIFSACSFDEPVMPTWAVPVNLPLAEETFKIGDEIVNDSTIIVGDEDSLIYISFDGDLEGLEISASDFKLNGIDTSHRFELGTISLDSIEALNSGPLSLASIFPELANLVLPGQTIPLTVPDTTIVPPPVTLEAGDFVGIHVINGTLRLAIRNDLPFPIGPNTSQPNGLQITVADSTGQNILQMNISDVIWPGTEIEQTASFPGSGTWVFAPLTITYVLPIAQPTPILLSQQLVDTSRVAFGLWLENLEIDEAIAQIEPQQISDSKSFSLNDQNRLREAVLAHGEIQLDFNNRTPLHTIVSYRLPNFIDQSGRPLEGSIDILNESSSSQQISLDGFRIVNDQLPGNFIDSIRVEYQAYAEGTNNILHVRSTDYIQVGITVDSLVFESFSGFLAADTFEIDPFVEDSLVDYQDMPTNIRLDNVDLGLRLSNEVSIENMFVDLNLIGYHRNDNGAITDSAVLQITQQQIVPGQPEQPGVSVINLSGPEVASFLNILPTSIATSGRVCASGNVEISRNSRVSGQYSFSTPMRFQIEGDARIEGDVDTLQSKDIDSDIQSANDENFESAGLALRLTNATPLGGQIRLIVSADDQHTNLYDDSYFNPALEFAKEISVQPAQTDPQTGFTITPSENELFLNLTREEFRLFQNPPLRVGYQLVISGTNGVVSLRATDYITVSGVAKINLVVTN